jgi:hypothetical protein
MKFRTDTIKVSFVYPPIPTRSFDWCASYDNDEPDDDGNMLSGYGATPEAAVADLRAWEELNAD